MRKMIPLSLWAAASGLTRHQAFNLVRSGKVDGAEIRPITIRRWFVPADARPVLTDRRRRSARQPGSPNVRSA